MRCWDKNENITQNCGCLKITAGGCSPCFSVCSNNGREVEFINIDEFLPRVRLVAKGVPDDVAIEYINAAAVRFSRETLVLKRRLTIDIQAGVQDYFLKAGDYEQVYRLDDINHCKKNDWQFLPPDKLFLNNNYYNDIKNGLTVEYTATPNQNACMIDKLLYDYYQDAIVNGALAELLLMKHYAFSEPQYLSSVYEQKYNNAVGRAKTDMSRKFENRRNRLMQPSRL